jgi:hypothetical protein
MVRILDLPSGVREDELSWYRSHVSITNATDLVECMLTSRLKEPENYLRPAMWLKYVRARGVIAVSMFVLWVVAILVAAALYFRTATMSMDMSIVYILTHDVWCIVLESGLVISVLLAIALLTVHSKIRQSFDRQFGTEACVPGNTCVLIIDKTSPAMCVIDHAGIPVNATYRQLLKLMEDPALTFADMRRTLG